jgi:hypothetical protein
MPGTAARAQFLQQIHVGITAHRGLANLTRAAGTIGWSNAKALLISPAPVIGIFVGLGLCLAPLSRKCSEFTDALPVLTSAAWAVVVVSWIAVTIGDVCSYQASWHLLPLATVLYVACFLTGYRLGTHSHAQLLPAAACMALVASLAWTAMQTTVAADIAATRARVFDHNVSSVQLAVKQNPPRPAVWNSMSVAGIADVTASGANAFSSSAVDQWLGIPPGDLTVVAVSPPRIHFL